MDVEMDSEQASKIAKGITTYLRGIYRNKKHKLFKLWKKWKYIKFVLWNNYDWDQYYLIEMNILKLTMMGLEFAKFNPCVKETQVLQVHSVWEARKHFKHYINAFDIIYEQGQKKFIEKYGCRYETGDMLTRDAEDHKGVIFEGFNIISPKLDSKEAKKEAQDYWYDECFSVKKEYEYKKECTKKAFDIIHTNLEDWWT